ncbi:LpxI family protein [Capillibacterium thermochitinicola]|uniref:UDP-2,3-diacylglucosamine diphosphatase LpxI n=1 Tax=Capillibacterium thermochitinicola TaxID=2699427 RepID=A0A8J6HZV5_9FIRM|nr:UDP-2,3-diacylglucosamine diphosphatase LpxI [Capillibacterium thermochitinicola]MBA2132881.1 UDP-2,3-diacylglucosamine diphosphatase LpxI [Capillibacterium thermochitinicola]
MTWGILAGEGRLPLEVGKGMRAEGIEPVVLCTGKNADQFVEMGFTVGREQMGQLGAMRRFLQDHQVDQIVIAGRFGKEFLLAGSVDQEIMEILAKLTRRNDDALQLAVVNYFEEHGIRVETQTRFLRALIPDRGILAGQDLSPEEMADVRLGYRMAKEIGRLDIGQSVVVKKGMVLAIEAVEGTDQTIRRGGLYGGPGVVVVKVAKPEQDLRFDMPAIGLNTLEAMIEIKARVLGVEAGATFLLDREELLERAEKHGITVVAIDELTIKGN